MRFLILLLLLYILYRLVRGLLKGKKRVSRVDPHGTVDELVQDPVCKTYVPMRESTRRVIRGKEYFFCSQKCADIYEEQMKRV